MSRFQGHLEGLSDQVHVVSEQEGGIKLSLGFWLETETKGGRGECRKESKMVNLKEKVMNLVLHTGLEFLGGDAHRAVGYMRGWGLYGVIFIS